MTRRRVIKGVLNNFLGTYTSRYSDYDGYWLFGFLVDRLGHVTIDLLSPPKDWTDKSPMATAVRLAVQKFTEQVEKAGLTLSCIQEAQLEITKMPIPRTAVLEDGSRRQGYDVVFAARAVSVYGKVFDSERSIFVAPHDPSVERRSMSNPPKMGCKQLLRRVFRSFKCDAEVNIVSKKVLLVDDDRSVLLLMQVCYPGHGYKAITAVGAREAVMKIAKEHPDLVVLLHNMMPYSDGFEILQILRRDPTTAKIPVIMLTAQAEDACLSDGSDSSVDFYLAKPVDILDLNALIARILDLPCDEPSDDHTTK